MSDITASAGEPSVREVSVRKYRHEQLPKTRSV